MKKHLYILIINCSLLITHCYSQWLQMPAFPVNGNVQSIAFINKDTGYVSLISPASLLRTTNSGQSWNIIGGYDMRNLQFIDNMTGYSNGYFGANTRIYKTVNGGLNWDSLFISGNAYGDVFFVNKDTGWVCGFNGFDGVIWKTTNGGGYLFNNM